MNPSLGGVAAAIRNFEMGFKTLSLNHTYSHVVCFDEQDEVNNWDNKGLVIHALGKSRTPWQYNSSFGLWLSRYLRDYEVVIIHGLWVYHSYATTKYIRKYQQNSSFPIKIYIMPHGMLDPWFQKEKSRKLKAIRNEIYWKLIEKNVVNKADGILFTCEQERLLANQSFANYNPSKEYVVGLGITEPPVFSQVMEQEFINSYPKLKHKKFILFLGRIDYKKGVDLLIKAYQRILRSNEISQQDLPYLVLAGPGIETSFGSSIKQIVEQDSELCDRVFFTGMLSGNTKWGAFYGCEAFILPSHQENFGIAVVESLACRKPVLISNQVNIWREIASGGGGLVSDDTEEGTYQLIMNFCKMLQDNKEEMSTHALEVYQKFFSIEIAAQALYNVINESN
jgi:glycosyltransferase involved in cell wall biosynthesis